MPPIDEAATVALFAAAERHLFDTSRRRLPVPVMLVSGALGSGKTTLARAIRKQLQTDIADLSHDNYYKDLRHLSLEERETHNFDHPDALDTDLLFEHLKELKG